MFQWDKKINAINIPSGNVVHLFRSMRELQLALPGVSAQQASAFLCQYQIDGGVGTAVVFHLHKSETLAFYFSEPRVVPEQNMDSMLDQGLNFVESMGFLMTDQDIHLLDVDDREMLWASLPINSGLLLEKEPPATTAPAQGQSEKPAPMVETVKVEVVQKEAKVNVAAPPVVKNRTSAVGSLGKSASVLEPGPEVVENVDDLLAAVEAMRAKRPGLRARKTPPSAEEMGRRRLQLRETIGRILASL